MNLTFLRDYIPNKYFPNDYVEDVFSIDYKHLRERGYRGLIFEIDGTLVARENGVSERIFSLFGELKSLGFKPFILSDSSRERVKIFNEKLHCPYIYEAGKPDSLPFTKAVSMMRENNRSVVVIGDSIFTDIAGASKAGLASILVRPVNSDVDEGRKERMKRRIEGYILNLRSKLSNKPSLFK